VAGRLLEVENLKVYFSLTTVGAAAPAGAAR